MEPSIDQLKVLQAQLTKLTAENNTLQSELSRLRSSIVSDWTLRQRTPMSTIFSRPDHGSGLVGSTIGVAGWIKSIRLQGKNSFAFVTINDGSSWDDMQVIVDKSTPGFGLIEDKKASTAASVFVIGRIVDSKGKKARRLSYRLLKFDY